MEVSRMTSLMKQIKRERSVTTLRGCFSIFKDPIFGCITREFDSQDRVATEKRGILKKQEEKST